MESIFKCPHPTQLIVQEIYTNKENIVLYVVKANKCYSFLILPTLDSIFLHIKSCIFNGLMVEIKIIYMPKFEKIIARL